MILSVRRPVTQADSISVAESHHACLDKMSYRAAGLSIHSPLCSYGMQPLLQLARS